MLALTIGTIGRGAYGQAGVVNLYYPVEVWLTRLHLLCLTYAV